MQEGYYISVYGCIDPLQNILDIKLRHDQTVALWKYQEQRIELIRYWELERISGLKQHAKALFSKDTFYLLLKHLLKEEGIGLDDIIDIWGTKELESNCSYRTQFEEKYAFHSIAHLLTAICFQNEDPFHDSILGMALDAGPDSMFEPNAYERLYYSACVIHNSRITYFSVESPARLWSYAYKKFGLREGTLMALSNAMDTKCEVPNDLLQQWSAYTFYDEHSRYHAQEVVEAISAYVLSVDKSSSGRTGQNYDSRFSKEDNYISMVMKIITELSLNIVCRNIDRAVETYQLDTKNMTLALSGGFALNCPINTAILERYKFRSYQIPPCASDTGIAMGIGIAAFYPLLNKGQAKLDIHSAFLGQQVNDVEQAVSRYKDHIQQLRPITMDEITELLANGEIFIWLNGSAEIGPRALGNRSLLADARTIASKNRLNEIKKRQWWRPVAPLILDECGEKYFENYRTSPNMLLNLMVRKEKEKMIPAVVHFDGSARVQSVDLNENKVLYTLLKNFYKKTGVPVLCNTSLNDAGEPIINSVEEAIVFGLHKGLNYVCVNGNTLIQLKKVDMELGKVAQLRNRELFFASESFGVQEFLREENPHKLSVEELTFYYDNPGRFKGLSLRNEECAQEVRVATAAYLETYKNGLRR